MVVAVRVPLDTGAIFLFSTRILAQLWFRLRGVTFSFHPRSLLAFSAPSANPFYTMADDGGMAAGGGHVAADGHHYDTDKIMPQIKYDSRKSTWVKSAFDQKVEGMATPLGAQSARSSHGIDLDEYFVRSSPPLSLPRRI